VVSGRPIWLVAGAVGFVLLALGFVPVTTLLTPYSSRADSNELHPETFNDTLSSRTTIEAFSP
jgi:hypothetical protein